MIRIIKETLERKFAEENCYFTMQDVNVLCKLVRHDEEEKIGITKLDSRCYKIFIKEYEHINFAMYTGMDDYFGKVVLIYENCIDTTTDIIYESRNIVFEDSFSRDWEYVINSALVKLGYYISDTF